MYDEEKERLKAELAELKKKKVRSNPWPWLAGGIAIGIAIGVLLF